MSSDWRDPEWQRSAYAWIDAELKRLGITRDGEIEQPHVYVWSTVMRVPTDAGDLWFKANMDTLRHEAAVAELLSERLPDVVPPLLAVDRTSGWMLMTDAGEQLRDVIAREASLDRWFDVLRQYAALQLRCIDDVDRLLAAGVPDLRMTTLPEKYHRLVHSIDVEQRFRGAVPYVEELCSQLTAYGIPETIQHDDLHDGQVFVRDGRNLVMDWGDACVSHPFFTLSVTLEGVIAWGLDDEEDSADIVPFRDAYLEPFAARYAGDLAAAVDVALRLGWAGRAVNGHVPGDDDRTRTRLGMFLDGHP
jgi:aminoglycoside phosphotransferase (APT) family kinase protein